MSDSIKAGYSASPDGLVAPQGTSYEGQCISANLLKSHRCSDSAWIVLFGRVYDVTGFLSSHPGGEQVLLAAAGKDATKVWSAIHKQEMLDSPLVPCLGTLAADYISSLEEHEFVKPEATTSNDDIIYTPNEDAKVLKARKRRAQAINVRNTMAMIDALIQIQCGQMKNMHLERVISLAEERGDPNCTDQDGQGGITPLGIAATVGSSEQIQRLLSVNADPNYRTEKNVSILHKFAARPLPDASAAEILSLLLQAQCNINSQMYNGRTPLHVAAQWGQAEMVRMLLNNGANPRIRAGVDGSPADWARTTVLNKGKLKAVLQTLESKR